MPSYGGLFEYLLQPDRSVGRKICSNYLNAKITLNEINIGCKTTHNVRNKILTKILMHPPRNSSAGILDSTLLAILHCLVLD